MKNLFVPYEIALELKELGFDGPCFGYWDYSRGNKITYKQGDNWNSKKVVGKNYIACSAPLYQQVIDWFIEKHNIVFGLDAYGDYNFAIKIWQKGVNTNKPNSYSYYNMTEYFDTHYEALNSAIEEALKLIKLKYEK